jgi:hypothetical protein
MNTCTELQTIRISYQEICEGEDPWLPLGNFMNDFFGNFTDLRLELVREALQEPAEVKPELHQWAVFCAATVEYLCSRYEIPCPDWVNDSAYDALLEPWFFSPMAAHKPHVRERLMRETAEPFSRRNIFCGNRVFANKYEAAEEVRQRRSA